MTTPVNASAANHGLGLDWNTGADWHPVRADDAGAVPVTVYEF